MLPLKPRPTRTIAKNRDRDGKSTTHPAQPTLGPDKESMQPGSNRPTKSPTSGTARPAPARD